MSSGDALIEKRDERGKTPPNLCQTSLERKGEGEREGQEL